MIVGYFSIEWREEKTISQRFFFHRYHRNAQSEAWITSFENYHRKLFFCHFYGVLLFKRQNNNAWQWKIARIKNHRRGGILPRIRFHTSSRRIDWLLSSHKSILQIRNERRRSSIRSFIHTHSVQSFRLMRFGAVIFKLIKMFKEQIP